MDLLSYLESTGRWALHQRGLRSRHVPTSIGTVHMLESPGQGALPPVVFIHGLGSSSMGFWRTIEHFRAHSQHVIAPDLPGHGASEAPPEVSPEHVFMGLLEALDQVIEAPVFLVGNSLGGAMALQYSLVRPEKVRGLVLCSPGGAPPADMELPQFLTRFQLNTLADARTFLGQLLPKPPIYTPLIAPIVRANLQRPFLRSLIASFRAEHAFTPEVLAGLSLPTLFIWGQSDRLLLPEMRDFYVRHLPPHVEIDEPPTFGHSPQVDQPAAFAARILEFVQKIG